MKQSLKVGAIQVSTVKVDTARTIAFMGDSLRVYATPSMVHDVEHACRDLLKQHHDAGEDSIGAQVVIDHTAATLLDQSVTITVVVSEIQLPRVSFRFEVKDELDAVGHGTHLRFVVDTEKQGQRLAKKATRLGAREPG
jgi:predicted thioesterase